ncbi:MAG: GerMN domain-containing protein [Selenomonadaceae bacterium]|nr:GerMN domain-containing protein [Selenomonadaceae bacterium]
MKKIFLPAMLALLIFTAGCEQPPSDTPTAPPPDKPATTAPDKKPASQPEVKPSPEVDKPSTTESNPSATSEKSAHAMNIKVYYPDDSGMRLVEVEREITVDDPNDKYLVAVESLRDDPNDANLTRIFPSNAAIRSVTVEDGMAIVDFDGGILKSFVGGSTGEEFLIGSIVDTLTNFPEVTSVKFLVDGQEIETLSGHMDLSIPLERMNDLTE